MNVAFLAPANSIHTQRWVDALSGRGHRLTVFSQHRDPRPFARASVVVEWLPFHGKLGYVLNAIPLRARLAELGPDLLNVHYASGYGTTAALTGFRPSLLSVWGSDVYDFPHESLWKAALLRYNLRCATRVASTSHTMAKHVQKLVPGLPASFVTSFGVDCSQWQPNPRRDTQYITIGTSKTLAYKYGIDVLIDAFSRLLRDPALRDGRLTPRLRLMLIGDGPQRAALEHLATKVGVRDKVVFVGPVAHNDVPTWLNQLDVYVAASRLESESFGVAVVEASACGLPVVVSDAGGLPEVVQHGVTGLVVPREDAAQLAAAIKRLILEGDLRRQMGQAGRRFVVSTYEWEHCVDVMEAAYLEVIAGAANPEGSA